MTTEKAIEYLPIVIEYLVAPFLAYLFYSFRQTLKSIESNTNQIVELKGQLSSQFTDLKQISEKIINVREDHINMKQSLKTSWIKYDMLEEKLSDLKERINQIEKR